MEKNEKIMLGQRFTIGFRGTVLDSDTIEIIKKRKIGNIILFQHNIENRKQLKALTDSIKALITSETGIEPFIMIDQEGGMVTRLSPDFVNTPGAMAIHATGKPDNARICGQITGKELASAGVNFDIAPVLDINSNPNNPVIGVRSYGEDAQSVSEYSLKMIQGLKDQGIISCAKHFPGHGDTSMDSHLGLPVINKSLEQLFDLELKPFASAIASDIPSIMTTHILFPQIDNSGVPATMSSVILKDLLRKQMGFKGLIITDCLEMGAISAHYGTVNAVKTALDNGADIACISHHAELADSAIENMERLGLNQAQLEASFERILEIKAKYKHICSAGATHEDKLENEKILENSLTFCSPQASRPQLGASPVFIGCSPFVVTMASNPENKDLSFSRHLQKVFGGLGIESSIDPSDSEIKDIANQIKGCSSIVFGTYNAHVKKGQLALGKALETLGIPMTVVALRNPFDLAFFEKDTFSLAIFEYTDQSLNVLSKFFKNEITANGKPCFNLGEPHA